MATLKPVDHDPFASVPMAPARPETQPENLQPSRRLTPVDHDPFAADASANPNEMPSWWELPGNIGPSAVELGKNLVQPILHPIDTLESFRDIGYGLLDKIGIRDDPDAEAKVDAIGAYFADRYGTPDGFKRALITDPVGILADATAVVSGGTSLLARAPGMVGKAARIANTVSNAVDPVRAIGKTVAAVPKGVRSTVKAIRNNVPEPLGGYSPAQRSFNSIDKGVMESGRSATDLAADVSRNPRLTLADVDPNMQQRLMGVASQPGEGRTIASRAVDLRRRTAAGANEAAFDAHLGVPPDVQQHMLQVAAEKANEANIGFGEALRGARPVDISPVIAFIDQRLRPGVNSVMSNSTQMPSWPGRSRIDPHP
jgi:hypothetical protein